MIVESPTIKDAIALEAIPVDSRVRKPDPLDTLFDEHFDAVYRFLSRRLGNPDDAKDVAAETFAAALLKRCPRGVAERCWLYGIARRKLADALRKRQRHENLDPNLADPANFEATLALRRSIEALPQDQRDAFLLQTLEELSVDEIAHVMRRSRTSVKALLQRARETLRRDHNDFQEVRDARE
jgi:RNA polymerase sigma-70 factor, ECF subfamily